MDTHFKGLIATSCGPSINSIRFGGQGGQILLHVTCTLNAKGAEVWIACKIICIINGMPPIFFINHNIHNMSIVLE